MSRSELKIRKHKGVAVTERKLGWGLVNEDAMA
jgi:hypothetical protein